MHEVFGYVAGFVIAVGIASVLVSLLTGHRGERP